MFSRSKCILFNGTGYWNNRYGNYHLPKQLQVSDTTLEYNCVNMLIQLFAFTSFSFRYFVSLIFFSNLLKQRKTNYSNIWPVCHDKVPTKFRYKMEIEFKESERRNLDTDQTRKKDAVDRNMECIKTSHFISILLLIEDKYRRIIWMMTKEKRINSDGNIKK